MNRISHIGQIYSAVITPIIAGATTTTYRWRIVIAEDGTRLLICDGIANAPILDSFRDAVPQLDALIADNNIPPQ